LKPAKTEGTATRAPEPPPAMRRLDALNEAERSLLEEFGQRTRTSLIIERPGHFLSARKLTNHLVTLLWWSVWARFLLPLVTLVLWMSGSRRFSTQLLGSDGLNALLSRLPLYATVVGVLCGTLIVWALINWLRFYHRERRKFFSAVGQEASARAYGVDAKALARWQAQRRLVVQHDAQGRPTGVLESSAACPVHLNDPMP